MKPRRATLPRVRVREKHLRRYNLARLLDCAPLRRHRGLVVGLVNAGDDADEIWVEKNLSPAERRFTVLHERVHRRRQMAGEEVADSTREEACVELETVTRASDRVLRCLPYPTLLLTIKEALTGGYLDPNRRRDLDKIYHRIASLLLAPRQGRMAAQRPVSPRGVWAFPRGQAAPRARPHGSD